MTEESRNLANRSESDSRIGVQKRSKLLSACLPPSMEGEAMAAFFMQITQSSRVRGCQSGKGAAWRQAAASPH